MRRVHLTWLSLVDFAGEGFDNHIKDRHNPWKYMFFVIYLRQRVAADATSLTGNAQCGCRRVGALAKPIVSPFTPLAGQEARVWRCIQESAFDWLGFTAVGGDMVSSLTVALDCRCMSVHGVLSVQLRESSGPDVGSELAGLKGDLVRPEICSGLANRGDEEPLNSFVLYLFGLPVRCCTKRSWP